MSEAKIIQADEWDDGYPLTCKVCGFSGDVRDDFDTMGACIDQVLCNHCHAEIDASTGEPHQPCEQCKDFEV